MSVMPRFEDIPQFTRGASYAVDIPWSHLLERLEHYRECGLNLDPDFQRAHVWDDEKRIRYVEYVLRGGASGYDIYTNCPDWNAGGQEDFVLVDGKQRLEAACKFLRNELPIFGHLFRQYTDRMGFTSARFRWHVNDLATRQEVLRWYLDLNTGGVVHSSEELDRVRVLLETEKANPNPKDVARAARIAKERADMKRRRQRGER
jgi:hypothetical protein